MIDFAANVAKMRDDLLASLDVQGLSPGGYPLEECRLEARMFACPTCAHFGPDHRWSPPYDCLVAGADGKPCPCKMPDVELEADAASDAVTLTTNIAFDAAWPAAPEER